MGILELKEEEEEEDMLSIVLQGSISGLECLEEGLDNLQNYFQAGITALSPAQLPLPGDDDDDE
eukprot:12209785-Ditylum_brightwellii.AAC.1